MKFFDFSIGSQSLDSNWVAVYASVGVVSGIGLIAIIVASIKFCQRGQASFTLRKRIRKPGYHEHDSNFSLNFPKQEGRNTFADRLTSSRKSPGNLLESVDYLQQFRHRKGSGACKKVSIFNGRKSGKTRKDMGRSTMTSILKKRASSSGGSKNAKSGPKHKAAMHDYVIEDRKETANTNRGQLRNQPRVMNKEQESVEWQHNDNNDGNGTPVPEEEDNLKDGQEDGNGPIKETNENQSNDENDDLDSDEQDGRKESYEKSGTNRMNDWDGNDGLNDYDDSEMTISWSGDETEIDGNDEDSDENTFLDPD